MMVHQPYSTAGGTAADLRRTAEVLDRLAARIPNLRVVHMARNSGKATAMNAGALMARHEILVCIDGDALLDPHALRWIAHVFERAEVGD
jgi:biofilm PGA synthesis N-glycosyltransferase PgaC